MKKGMKSILSALVVCSMVVTMFAATGLSAKADTATKATNPTPADDFVTAARSNLSLQWTPAACDSQNIYFGATQTDVENATQPTATLGGAAASYTLNQSVTAGDTYYWRVDSTSGSTVTKGDVWSFHVSEPKIKVYLIAGQSNAEGYTYTQYLDPQYAGVQKKVLYYMSGYPKTDPPNVDDVWEYVQPGEGLDIDHFGPELGMGNILAPSADGEYVAIIKYAWGGTSLSGPWCPPASRTPPGSASTDSVGNLYTNFINTVGNGISKLKVQGFDPEIDGMVWLQGDNDAGTPDVSNAYNQNLKNFIKDVRGDLSVPNLPIVVSQVYSSMVWPFIQTIRKAEADVVSETPNTALVTGDDLPYADYDYYHYSADSQWKIGQRNGSALLWLTEPATVGSVTPLSISTPAGEAPQLPQYVETKCTNGETRMAPVTWDAVSADKYAKAGTTFTVTGTASYTTIKATANITVTAPVAIDVDGDLSDANWVNAPSVKLYDQTVVKSLYTKEGLYFSFNVTDPYIENLDGNDFNDDSIEIHIDPLNDGGDFSQADDVGFTLTCAKMIAVWHGTGVSSNAWTYVNNRQGNFQYAIKLNGTPNYDADIDTGETYEFFAPWSALGGEPAGGVVGVDFSKDNSTPNFSGGYNYSWCDVPGHDFQKPGTYLKLSEAGLNETVASIEPVAVSTPAGTAPSLPDKVTVTNADSTQANVNVTWNAVDPSSYEKVCTFTVTGTVKMSSLPVTATVTVTESDVQKLIDAIGALPNPVTMADADTVDALEATFSGLSAAQQAKVTNASTLSAAVSKIASLRADQAAADAVTAKIAALSSTISLADKTAVAAARNAYDALSASQKQLVTNYQKLTDAEAAVTSLENAANAVTAQIAALNSTVTLADKSAVAAVRAAYNALSASQKQLVTNYQKLTDAEVAIANLEKQSSSPSSSSKPASSEKSGTSGTSGGSSSIPYTGNAWPAAGSVGLLLAAACAAAFGLRGRTGKRA